MVMGIFWTLMVTVSLVYGAVSGRLSAVTAAALEGAAAAVELVLVMAGALCLWSGVLELMRRSGMAAGLSRLLRPVLRRLLPQAGRDEETLDALSANVSANLLGLGNAATPLGIQAACRMARGCGGTAIHHAAHAAGTSTASESPGYNSAGSCSHGLPGGSTSAVHRHSAAHSSHNTV